MGMHYGLIAARVPADRLFGAINAHASRLEPGEPANRFDDLPLDASDGGWAMAYGERDGVTYVFDTSVVLSGSLDLIAALSRDVGTTVLGCGAETVSGTYWFVAAHDGQLIRGYWNCFMDMREPWSHGPRFASEARAPLDGDLDGSGLMAAARELGFDVGAWLNSGPYRALTYIAERFPTKGPLGEELERFLESVALPKDRRPKLTTVVRTRDGAIVDTTRPKRKGLLTALFGR